MATKMRLMRMGKKKQPFYRIVVVEDTAPRESKYIDLIGWYNPMKENQISLDETKVIKWLGHGVEPTDTVRCLLSNSGLLKKFEEQKPKKTAKNS